MTLLMTELGMDHHHDLEKAEIGNQEIFLFLIKGTTFTNFTNNIPIE